MPQHGPEQDLVAKLDEHFESYAKKQAILAITVTILVTLICTAGIYLVSKSILISAIAAAFIGVILFYFMLISIVPPKNKLNRFKKLMIHAMQHHTAILKSTPNLVIIKGKKGLPQTLTTHERHIWQEIVSPHIRTHTNSETQAAPTKPKSSRKKVAGPPSMQSELDALIGFKKRLEAEKLELDRRNLELSEAEDMVVDRLYNVDVAQAQLEQLQIEANDTNSNQDTDELLRRLNAKEKEVENLKSELNEDQKIVQAQKTELNQLKGELIKEFDATPTGTVADGEEAELIDRLNNKLEDVESVKQQLRTRDSHLTEAENVLIQRLQELAEREAALEQNEINAGIRKDD